MPDAKAQTAALSLNAPSIPQVLSTTAAEYRDKGAEIFAGAREFVEEGACQIKEKFAALGEIDFAEASKKAAITMRKNPGKTLLIAAGAGVALGIALRLMSR